MGKLSRFFWGNAIPTDKDIIAWEKTRVKGFWIFALRSVSLYAGLFFLLSILEFFIFKQWSRRILIFNILEAFFLGMIIAFYGWRELKDRFGNLTHTLPTASQTNTLNTSQEQQ